MVYTINYFIFAIYLFYLLHFYKSKHYYGKRRKSDDWRRES
jgi:hypothetical protein